MRMLFVDACPRGTLSRTLRLAHSFSEVLARRYPGAAVETVRLTDLRLKPYDGSDVERREALIEEGRFDEPLFALARSFAGADLIAVAAPYWDMSFPAMLKVYVEHVFARRVTFYYDERGPVGLCRATDMVYLTTSGSPIGDRDFGADYMRAVSGMLGVKRFHRFSAEGLDIDGADADAILEQAEAAVRDFAERLNI